MKKVLLKVFGVAALAAGMMYNVQVFDTANSSDISLAALGSIAVAQSEGGGSINCGPLYGNSSGSRYCCGNTNQDHCNAAAC